MLYPQQYNFFMPPEWDPHECCWMQWPHEFKDKNSYKEIESWSHFDFEKGRYKWAEVSKAISKFEKVNMIVHPEDIEIAKTFGVATDKIYASVFALGGGLAAIAGVLIVPIRQADYLMGLDPLLLSFIVVIIGGLGSIRGTIVAAFIIGISDGIISVFYEPTLAKMLATSLVAMVLVFKPTGLFGGVQA